MLKWAGALQVDPRIDVARILRQDAAEFGGSFVETGRAHQHDAEIVARRRVLRVDDQGPLKLPNGFTREPSVSIQETQVVVDLRIELVAREQRPIVGLRRAEIAGAMVIQR